MLTSSEAIEQLLNGPGLTPPPGVVPNLISPPNLQGYLALTLTFCVSFSTLAVAIRIYTRLYITRNIGWDDYTSFLGWLLFIGELVPSILAFNYGGGVHQWNVPLKNVFTLLYYVHITEVLYGIVIFVLKLSILLQYLRIFVPTRKGNMFMFIGVHVIIWSNFLFILITDFFVIFACRPREMIWNKLIFGGHCYNVDAILIATAIFNLISDFSILLLPLRSIWKLQVPRRKKYAISAVFAWGLFSCCTSIARLILTLRVAQSDDVTYNIVLMGFCIYAEEASGIICGCLPVMPKFFQIIIPKFKTTILSSNHSKQMYPMQSVPITSRSNRPLVKHNDANKSHDYSILPHNPQNQPLSEPETTQKGSSTTDNSMSGSAQSSLATFGSSVKGNGGLERGRGINGILRTVHIKTEEQANDRFATDLERQRQRHEAWD